MSESQVVPRTFQTTIVVFVLDGILIPLPKQICCMILCVSLVIGKSPRKLLVFLVLKHKWICIHRKFRFLCDFQWLFKKQEIVINLEIYLIVSSVGGNKEILATLQVCQSVKSFYKNFKLYHRRFYSWGSGNPVTKTNFAAYITS